MDYHSTTTQEHLTYAIGDIPQNAERLQQIGSALYDAMRQDTEEAIPLPNERDDIDRYIETEIYPIADGDPRQPGKGPGRPEQGEDNSIELLYDLRDMWGNDSEVVGWRFKSKATQRPDHKKREEDYRAVLLKNEDDEVVAMVSDTREKRNSLYLWRADASEAVSYLEALDQWKHDARDSHVNARRFMHREGRDGLDNRVYNTLTMPVDAYKKQRDTERKQAAKRRETRARKIGEVGLSNEE